jgi:hypothetical protein
MTRLNVSLDNVPTIHSLKRQFEHLHAINFGLSTNVRFVGVAFEADTIVGKGEIFPSHQ